MVFPEIEIPQYGFFDSRIKFPKAIMTEPRQVTVFEIELYTEDQPGISYIGSTAIPLRRGTLICARPGDIRYSKLHFKCLHLHLKTEDPVLTAGLSRLPRASEVTDLAPFTEIFHKILSLDMKSFPEQRLLMQSYLYRFLFLLTEESRSTDSSYSHRKTMLSVEDYIRANLSAELDLNTLAARANLSPVYFHKLFSAHVGMTPAAFVLSCRMAAAKAMLKTGDLSIAEIASRCGFGSQSYFNYKFKQQFGETPLHYRNARLSRMKV